MNSGYRNRLHKKRSLRLQSLEERILWDATLAPEPESATVDQAANDQQEALPVDESLVDQPLSNPPPEETSDAESEEASEEASLKAVTVPENSDGNELEGDQVDLEVAGESLPAETNDGQALNPDAGVAADEDSEITTDPVDETSVDGDISASPADGEDQATESASKKELVFVDSRVDGDSQANNADTLVNDILSQRSAEDPKIVEVVYLDQESSGLQQVTDTLSGYENLDALHIISHGEDGLLFLGNEEVTTETINASSAQLDVWRDVLTEQADILLYGCDVAETGTGQQFVDQLAVLTGADVAASDNTTGNAASGGDWTLEYHAGEVEARTVMQADGAWVGQLADEVAAGDVIASADAMIDESPQVFLTFDNTGVDPGYAPYADFVSGPGLDVNGGTYLGSPVPDFTDVAVWNATDNEWQTPLGDAVADHPFEGDAGGAGGLPLPDGSGLQDGASWYSFKLPFGSVVPAQPTFVIDLDVEFNDDAVVGQPINMEYTPGFLLGGEDDGSEDPHVGATTTATTTPTVIQIEKRNDLPESETPTGPNYPVEFTITVNVAEGETVDNVVVQDFLPANANLIGTAADIDVSTINGGSFTGTPDISLAGNTLEIDLGSVTGGAGVTGPSAASGEVEIVYYAWFSDIVPDTGNSVLSMNESTVSGNYTNDDSVTTPVQDIDDADVGGPDGSLDDGDALTEAQNLTTQKSVQPVAGFDADGNPIFAPVSDLTPGDYLYWTVEVQVSDYHAFDDVVFTDLLGDGQDFVDGLITIGSTSGSGNPTLVVNNDTGFGGNTDDSALGLNDFSGVNYTVTPNIPTGETEIVFNISDQLIELGGDGVLVGDLNHLDNGDGITVSEAAGESDTADPTPPPTPRVGPNATTVSLTFYSQVRESYTDAAGENIINSGDSINNTGEISGEIGDVVDDNGTFSGDEVVLTDGTAESIEIGAPVIQKTIFAVNGVEVQSPNADEDDNESDEAIIAGIQPGDVVTYRLRVELPSANGEQLVISDFLPLPVYNAAGEFTIDPTFGNTLPAGTSPGSAATQAALAASGGGDLFYGEDYNLHTVGSDLNIIEPPDGVPAGNHPTDNSYPDVSLNAASNALYFDFGTFDEMDAGGDGSEPVVLDLLLNVTVQDVDFADGLLLTNQTELTHLNSEGEVLTEAALVQVGFVAPALKLTKGVVAISGSSNGNNTPIAPDFGVTFNNTEPGAGVGAGDALLFDGDGITLDDLSGGLGVLDGDATQMDGADWVRYALTLQNDGQGDAHDILISDSLPQNSAGADGFVLPADSTDSAALINALNIQVFYGDGTRVDNSELEVSVVGGELMVEIAAEIDGRTIDPDSGDEVADSDEIRTDANPGNGDQGDVTQNIVDGDEILIVTYDLQIDNETTEDAEVVVAGDVFDNTATIEEYYQTAEDDPARNDDNNRALLDDPADLTDDASVTIRSPQVEKTLIGTGLDSDNNAGSNEVVIGERVTYEVRLTIPEGQTLDAALIDNLDPGLELSSIDSIAVVDQNDDPVAGVITSSIWGANFSGFAPQSDASDPNVSYDFNDAGSSQLSLALGDLVNTDTNDANDEVIVVTYTAMVTNDAGSEQGDVRNNAASVQFVDSAGDTVQSNVGSADNVTILEPLLEVVKTVSIDGTGSTGNANDEVNPDTAAGDEGDMVTYTIVIQHTGDSDADAFDVNFADEVPGDIVNLVLVDAVYSGDGSDLVANGNITQSGNSLGTASDFTVELGETVTITVTGELGLNLGVGDTIDNTAGIDWTSFPETPDGTDFVPEGEEDVERGGGDNAPDGGEINDYEDQDPARIIVGTNEIEKFLVNSEITDEADATADGELAAANDSDGLNRGGEATIGETLTYQMVVTLAEGETDAAVIRDSLDPGLALVSIDAIFTQQFDTDNSAVINTASVSNLTVPGLGAGQSLAAPVTAPGGIVDYTIDGGDSGGDLITIDLGDINNANNNDSILEQIVVQYTVMVTDEGTNSGQGAGTPGTALDNSAELTWQNSQGDDVSSLPDSADSVEVIEPELEVLKDVSVDGPGDAGDEITYTITIQHTADSETDAFDVSLYDVLPDQVDFSGIVFGAGTNVSVTDTLNILTTADFEIDGAGGSNGALQFAATGNTSVDSSVTGSSSNVIDMPLSAVARVVTISITGVLQDSVEPGDVIANESEINYSSLDDNNDGDPDNDDEDDRSNFVDDGTQGERDYSDTDSAEDVTIISPTIAKELVGSDVDSDDNAENEATIGEIITYRVTVDVPEGSMSNAQIVDNLTAGLEFVDLVSVTGSSNGSSVVSNTAGIDLENTATISTITTGSAATGQGITFSFGDIYTAGDNTGVPPTSADQGLDQIVIEYRVVVVDLPINEDAEVRDNSAAFEFETTNEDGQTVTQSTNTVDAENITLIEPDLEIIKTVNGLADGEQAGPLDAGDTVTYTFVIQHTGDSSTDAYDVDFSDQIPPELENVTVDSAIYSFDSSDLANTDIVTDGSSVTTANAFDILFGETVTITVSGDITGATGPGALVVNTAEIDWTSLPEGHENDGGSNERGDPTDPDDVYSDDDPAEFITGVPEFSKDVISDSIHGDGDDDEPDLTIGEQVTFELVATLPEGTTPVLITDNLPPLVGLAPFAGDTDGVLEVLGAEVSFVGAGIIASSTGLTQGDTDSNPNIIVSDVSGDGFNDQVIFDFGAVEVDGDNVVDGDDNVIRVTVTAVVKNLPGSGGALNEGGDELTNEATLNFAEDPENPGEGEVILDDATVDIIEPELEVDKEFVDPATGDPVMGTVTPGDTVRIRLEVTNTGTANAYDVVIDDAYNADRPVFESPTPAPVPAGFTYAADAGGAGLGDDAVSFSADPGVFIASGETLVFEFDVVVTEAEIGAGAFEGLTVANTATVTGDSLDDENPEERDTEDEDTDVLFGDPGIEKTIIDTSVDDTGSGEFDDEIVDLTIGETVTYQLQITLPETDINNNGVSELSELVNTTLTDNLPENLDLVSATVVSIGSDITMSNFSGGETLSDPDISGTIGDASVTFNLGDIAVIDTGNDGNLADQQVVIEVTAIVKDDPVNAADADKTNVATLNYGGEEFTDNAVVEIVEPELEITKNFVDPVTGEPVFTAEAGEDVQIELIVENTGSAVAYDVVITDDLNSNIPDYFVSGSASLVDDAGFTFDETADVVTFSNGAIDSGDTVIVRFNVTLMDPISFAPDEVILNAADVVGDSLPPGDPNEGEQRETTDVDEDELYGLPAIAKEVADNYTDVPPGDADTEATSHGGTGDDQFDPTLSDVTVGEVTTYEVTIVIPNTYDDPDLTTVATTISDSLPVGMALVDARVVAIGGNTAAGATDGGEFVNSDYSGVTSGPASSGLAVGDSLVAGSTNITGSVGGSSVTFDFGGLAVDARIVDESGDGDAGNDDDDLVGTEQSIVIQVDAILLDDASNTAGEVKENTSTLVWEETPDNPITIDDTAEIEVVHPTLNIAKTFIDPDSGADVYTVGEGDQVVVVLEVTNSGTANAYDALVEDEIDLDNWVIVGPQLTPPGFVYSVEDGLNPVLTDTVTFTMTSSGGAANPDNFIAPDETVRLEFLLEYTGAAEGGEQIDNTATVTGDSLPDDEIVDIPGIDTERETEDEDGDFVYEDPGLDKVVVEGLNPDTGSEQHSPTLVDLGIGEQVTYELTVTLPESMVDEFGNPVPTTVNLIDDLPDGFAVVGAEVTAIGSAVTPTDLAVGDTLTVLDPVTLGAGTPAATDDTDISAMDTNLPDGFEDHVLFSFGSVTVDDVNDLSLQTITVQVTAVVMDLEPENVDGEVRTNEATLEFFGTPTGDPDNPFDTETPIEIEDSADVEIVEPELDIQKRFFDAAGAVEVETVTAGDTVTVQLQVINTSTGPAYDLEINDPLDTTFFDASTISPVSTPAAFAFSVSGNTVTYTLDSGAGTAGSPAHVVMPGETVTFTFTVQVVNGIGPDTALNTATVDGDSAPGDNPFERDEPTREGSDELNIQPVPEPPSVEGPPTPNGEGDSETVTERVLQTYRYDVFDLIRDEFDELFAQIRNDIQHELPTLPVSYLSTGIAEHGSNVTMVIYDESGAIIGYSSTLADSAGNWVLNFPQTVLDKSPHHVEVRVTAVSYNESTSGEFNTRVYYSPAIEARASHYKGLQVGDVFSEKADSVLESIHEGNQTPFGTPADNWNHPYEFLGTVSIENI